MSKTLSTLDFLERSIKIHGSRYDYSISEYSGRFKKIAIMCRVHGVFYITPASHWNGSGCRECGNVRKGRSHRKSTDQFIAQAKKVHGDWYDYSKTEYRLAKQKVTITCPDHGDFEQTPSNHLYGFACKLCSVKSIPVIDAIEMAKEKHLNKYRYDKVVDQWVNMSEKVLIICPHHGGFYQSFSNHLNGRGCPSCNDSSGERDIKVILKNADVKFVCQYRFDGCRDKRALPFDFFIRSIGACIEYHGDQHFRATEKFGGERALKERKRRDQIKRDYCKKKGIPLLEVRYDDPDPESTVIEFLNKHSARQFVNPQLKLF